MSAASFWESLIWTRWSKPRCLGSLYQRVLREKPVRIVELGLADAVRAARLIRLAERAGDERIQYCGVDLFEARDADPLPLKKVHHQLAETGARVRLVPGDLFSSLGRTANLLSDTDLLVIDSVHHQEEIEAVCHFFPRMLHEGTAIARLERSDDLVRLRWLKSSDFLQTKRKAA